MRSSGLFKPPDKDVLFCLKKKDLCAIVVPEGFQNFVDPG